jgi:predicted  nucleic acid-binding Zn-ribbon protein
MESRHSNRAALSNAQSQLGALHDMGDTYTQKIEVENRNVRALDEQIQLLKQKILYQRKHMGGVNASRENQQMIQKQIRILENRLDKALVSLFMRTTHHVQSMIVHVRNGIFFAGQI